MDALELIKTKQQDSDPKSLSRIIAPVVQSLSVRPKEDFEVYTKRRRRYDRQMKVNKIRSRLTENIPYIFCRAKLYDLSSSFKSFLLDYDERVGLVLCGPTGAGKSYAMATLMRKLITNNRNVKRIGWEMLCIKIRATYSKDSGETEESILNELLKPHHLFIEDIGASKAINSPETEFAKRILYVLVDTRLEKGNATYITTNKTKEQLATTFDERIASRLECFRWIAVGGKDRRKAQ